MTATVSPAIAALFDQAANLTVEDALALAEQYKGQFFIRSAMKKGERPAVTTDHGRLVAKARREAEKSLRSSRSSILARARDVIVRRQVELIDELRMDDPRASDFRPAPFFLFSDAMLAELVADRPGVSKRSLELLRQDWYATIG